MEGIGEDGEERRGGSEKSRRDDEGIEWRRGMQFSFF